MHRREHIKHGLWVILPVRGIAQGKSRLASTLDSAKRARLNRWMLEHTLEIIARWLGDLNHCVVISACAQARRIALRMGARGLQEPRPTRGLNRAIERALNAARRRAARNVLILPVDLPRLSVDALDALAASARVGRCVIAPDSGRTGTNAILLRGRARFEFNYGPASFSRHLDAAHARGMNTAVCDHPHLRFDLDTPNDLVQWMGRRFALPATGRMVYSRKH